MKALTLLTMILLQLSCSHKYNERRISSIHPEDTDPLYRIGIGAKIILKSDINIKPEVSSIFIPNNSRGQDSCFLDFWKKVSHDRLLKAGSWTIHTVEKVPAASRSQYNFYLYVNSNTVEKIRCTGWGSAEDFSIGDFKNAYEDYFSIELSKPEEVTE